MWLNEVSGHGAGGLVSEWDNTIKSPWVRAVTNRYLSWYDHTCCQDVKLQTTNQGYRPKKEDDTLLLSVVSTYNSNKRIDDLLSSRTPGPETLEGRKSGNRRETFNPRMPQQRMRTGITITRDFRFFNNTRKHFLGTKREPRIPQRDFRWHF